MKIRTYMSLFAAAAFAVVCLTARAGDETTSTIKFSDPNKPGTLRITIGRGEVRIKGSDTQEISVRSSAQPVTQKRKDGLRVLTAASTFSLTEKDNVARLDNTAEGWHGGHGADFTISVPRSTNIVVNNNWGGGDVSVNNLTGDIEIECMHGEVKLSEISGGALVSTMNGEIHASLNKLSGDKPLSFSSMNGEVQLRLPADAKANLRLRTQNGSILTDFEETALVTKVENTPKVTSPRRTTTVRSKNGTVLSAEAQEAIRETARVGAETAREAMQAARDAVQAARDGIRDGKPEAPSAPAAPGAPGAPEAPKPPKFPSMATVTGGKLVSGTLNGGGPEINITTMNGDVTLRKLSGK